MVIRRSSVCLNLALDKVTGMLSQNGGIIQLSTTPHSAELQVFDPQYWKFHNCLGIQPGDEIWISEDYRVTHVCQSLDGFAITLQFKDEKCYRMQSAYPMPLTAKGAWNMASTMKRELSRMRCTVTDINCSGDNSEWQFTLVRDQSDIEEVTL